MFGADEDYEDWADRELREAERTLSGNLFHYTNADAAIVGILATGTLRLSPFDSTNDLWESRPTYPFLSSHADDLEVDPGFELWEEIDRHIRLNSKVTCLTLDWDLPDSVLDRDALRGWNHLSLWAHYGGAHSGVCLRFDQARLLESFTRAAKPGTRHLYRPVTYRSVSMGAGPHSIDIGQVREFGVDAVAIAYAEAHAGAVFFTKHRDWANETEYRLVRMDQSVLPFYLDVRETLTGVFLGDSFPDSRMPALNAVLRDYPGVEVFRLQFHNRRMMCNPPIDVATEVRGAGSVEVSAPWLPTRRDGDLEERLTALRMADSEAASLREGAEERLNPHLETLAARLSVLAQDLSSWPDVLIEVHPGIAAVPDAQRSRKPGVPGEHVHHEQGFLLVVSADQTRQDSLCASVALQALDEGVIRVHGVVTMEHLQRAPNHQNERWRSEREAPDSQTAAALSQVTEGLASAIHAAHEDFERERQDQAQTD